MFSGGKNFSGPLKQVPVFKRRCNWKHMYQSCEKYIFMGLKNYVCLTGEGKVWPDGCQMAKGTAGVAGSGTGR